MSGPRDPVVLSIVVIGRNEGERLRRCLESVRSMKRDGWEAELIYVDSGSTDGSVSLAESFGAKTIALQPQRPTAALGRNAGWRAARGKFIFFLDGDTIVDANFASHTLSAFDDSHVACVWGHRREENPTASVYNRVLDLDWIYAPGPAAFCGGDALFRRDALVEADGFDDALIAGEEPELCRRISAAGHRVLHVDLPMTLHDLQMKTFKQYWKRAVRAGHAFAEVGRRFAGTPDPFWSRERLRNRLHVFALLGLALFALLLSVVMLSAWPTLAALLVMLAIVGRTAWKARWKATDVPTLLLYALHSHVQQAPIFWGQLRFARNSRRGRSLGIVEYKDA